MMSTSSTNITFNKYLQNYVKDTEDPKSLTHLAFRGKGKYNVPDEKYQEFYRCYYKFLLKNEAMYIIEKINDNTKFAFFLDIETPKKSSYKIKINDIKVIIENTLTSINEMFESEDLDKSYIITRRNDKYHVNFSNVIVNTISSQRLAKNIIEKLNGDIKDAMKKGEKERLDAVRYLKSMLLENKTSKKPMHLTSKTSEYTQNL